MDPANYSDYSLPKIEYTELDKSQTFYFEKCGDSEDYIKFKELFSNYVSADCHAITCDDQVVYNCYQEKLLRDIILDEVVRREIINNPDMLFVPVLRNKKDARVIVYMLGDTPWFVACYYTASIDIMTVEFYRSDAFALQFPQQIRAPTNGTSE
jgi:hypothetical protein